MTRTFRKRSGLILGAVLLCCTLLPVVPAAAQSSQNPQSGSAGLEGTVQTPPPKDAPTIITPRDGSSFSAMPITVAGGCTSDLLIKVFANNVFVGSTMCVNGSYSLQVDLFDGRNDIVARIFDSLDQPGPDSNIVIVTYNNNQFSALNAPQLTLTSPYARRGVNPGEQLTWPIVINGGTAPYAASVDWGDGKGATLYSQPLAGAFNIEHVYDNSGVYTIVIKATDKNGQTAFLQLVGQANGAIGKTDAKGNNNFAVLATTQTKVSWLPVIIAAILMLFAFWLGRRYELTELRKHLEGMHD